MYGVVGPAKETPGTAVVAMILGIISFTLSCGPLTGIPALILGYKSRRQIDSDPNRYDGRGMATAGIILGWIGTILCGGFWLVYLVVIVIAAASGSGSGY
jgi:uncharacterized protein DUF4190